MFTDNLPTGSVVGAKCSRFIDTICSSGCVKYFCRLVSISFRDIICQVVQFEIRTGLVTIFLFYLQCEIALVLTFTYRIVISGSARTLSLWHKFDKSATYGVNYYWFPVITHFFYRKSHLTKLIRPFLINYLSEMQISLKLIQFRNNYVGLSVKEWLGYWPAHVEFIIVK